MSLLLLDYLVVGQNKHVRSTSYSSLGVELTCDSEPSKSESGRKVEYLPCTTEGSELRPLCRYIPSGRGFRARQAPSNQAVCNHKLDLWR